jgi:pimeloyl-ACP methyl ester carboxylesterase
MTARSEHVELPSGVTLHVVRHDPPTGRRTRPARPWILAHGLASNARLWDGVARHLAAAGHPVAAVDQRGHGRSSKPDDGYDMATVADDLELLRQALGWERPAVAGQSWGGNVVIEHAARHPGGAALVVCVDGGFIELRSRFPRWEDARDALAPPRLAGTPLERISGWLEQSAADWPPEGRAGTLANFEVRDDGTVAPWLTFDRHLRVLRGLWEHDPVERLASVASPVLFVVADTGDVNWTHSKEEAVERAATVHPASQVVWFRPAHHDVHAQRPADVAAAMLEALAAVETDADPA